MDLIRNHERRIKTKSKVADHIVFCRLVLQEFRRAGECDLRNILFYLFGCHTKTVIDEF